MEYINIQRSVCDHPIYHRYHHNPLTHIHHPHEGTIDMAEFHAFAADLYTYPPLRQTELADILVQVFPSP